ncbi:MAG: hypothetical protein AAFX50_07210, partial [Acidobacteriota bacterium]
MSASFQSGFSNTTAVDEVFFRVRKTPPQRRGSSLPVLNALELSICHESVDVGNGELTRAMHGSTALCSSKPAEVRLDIKRPESACMGKSWILTGAGALLLIVAHRLFVRMNKTRQKTLAAGSSVPNDRRVGKNQLVSRSLYLSKT